MATTAGGARRKKKNSRRVGYARDEDDADEESHHSGRGSAGVSRQLSVESTAAAVTPSAALNLGLFASMDLLPPTSSAASAPTITPSHMPNPVMAQSLAALPIAQQVRE
jgi:hypothetical protein